MAATELLLRLQSDLQRLADALPGVPGICVRDLTTGATIAINADDEFPTASTIKIHVLAQLYRRAEAGEIDLDHMVTITAADKVGGGGILSYMDGEVQLSVRDIANLMIMLSDNTATNLCIDWATMEGTNAMIRSLGLERTTLRRKMMDMEASARSHENTATPAELVGMLDVLHKQEQLSPYVCEQSLRVMKKPKKGYLRPGLPEHVVLAGKTGGMERVRNDAGIVCLARRPYAICVMTKYGLGAPVVQERFIADISQTVYRYMSILDTTNAFGQGLPPGAK